MRLLFDQNISRKALGAVRDVFPECVHVLDVGLDQATDREIWEYAEVNELVIVSKDSDFRGLAFLAGPPPKVVWIRAGSATTGEIVTLLLDEHERVLGFGEERDETLLVLEPRSKTRPDR